MKKNNSAKSLPVLMHHYINERNNSITVSPARFEEQCKAMQKHGWRGISLAEAEQFCINSQPLPAKSVLITFDDGYLDNYLYAMPILHKYGHQGVVFTTTARLEHETVCRASVEEVLAGTAQSFPHVAQPVFPDSLGLETRHDVFLSQAEAKAMHQKGVLALASHSHGHLGVYTESSFSGFVKPARQFRTFYLTSLGEVWGMPNFPIKPGLAHRAFIPSEKLVTAITAFVPQTKAEAYEFFADQRNEQGLSALVASFAGKLGRMETDKEMEVRMRQELLMGKEALEKITGAPVHTLCWPWGVCSPLAHRLALEVGFTMLVTTKEGCNPPGAAHDVKRFKVRNASGIWLLSRLHIYSQPLLGTLYARCRL